jgi:DNA-binding transcriptional LysR family regulator
MNSDFPISVSWLLSLASLLTLTACLPQQTTTPPASLRPLTVAFTPSLQPISIALNACVADFPQMALLVEEIPAPSIQNQSSDLKIWLGDPPDHDWFATPLAWEQIVIIVHPSNPLTSMSGENLSDLFTGRIKRWSELGGDEGEVVVWIYPKGDEIRQIFETNIMNGNQFSSQALLAPDPEAMLEAVAKDPVAIGFLPDAWITPQVKSIQVIPDLSNRLRQPVLALTAGEPHGLVRSYLLCLQGQTGQEILSTKYQPLIQATTTP